MQPQTNLQYNQSNISDSGKETMLTYSTIEYGSLAYNLAFTKATAQNLNKPYLKLSLLSGDPAHGNAEYFITSLTLPPPNTPNSNIRRVQFNLRYANPTNVGGID